MIIELSSLTKVRVGVNCVDCLTIHDTAIRYFYSQTGDVCFKSLLPRIACLHRFE